jgi:predicted DNA-binding transcriptional regulator YafY
LAQRLSYERYCWFHGQIKTGRYPNARTMAEKCEISGKQAQRDIEFARDIIGVPLQYNALQRGYEYADSAYELPPVWCSQDELLALCVALRLAAAVPDKQTKAFLHDLLGKFLNFRSAAPSPDLRSMETKISVKNIEYYRVDETIFHQTLSALFRGNSLRISYRTPHTGHDTERAILPLHLLHYMGNWHLIAFCSLKKDLRDFALSRIKRIEPAEHPVELPHGFLPVEDFITKSFGLINSGKEIEVCLLFSPDVAEWISEQVWHQSQEIGRNGDGSITLRFPVSDFREVKREILKYGAQVEVVSPVELRQDVKEEIEKMMAVYR